MVRNFFLVASLIVTSLTSVAAQEHVAQDASNFGKIFANNNQAVTTRESETFAADEFLELVSEMNPQSRIARLARSVGKLDVLTDAGSYVTCTAFLVDGNRLVTSYGCVSGILENPQTDGVEVASILFHAGYSGSDSVGATKTFYVKPTPIETNQMLGYSVLQLIGDANSTFGALTLSADQINVSDLLVVIGHPKGEEIRVSRFKCKVSSPSLVQENRFWSRQAA